MWYLKKYIQNKNFTYYVILQLNAKYAPIKGHTMDFFNNNIINNQLYYVLFEKKYSSNLIHDTNIKNKGVLMNTYSN